MNTREQIISARDTAIAEAQAKADRQLAELDGQGVGKCYRRNDCFWIIIGPIESGSLPFVSFNDIEISTGYLSSGLFEIDKTQIPRADFLAAYRKRMSAIHKAATGEELFGVEAVSKSTIEKLQKFKDYVHARLDEMGVPKELPESQHTKEGCRVGGRLDWVKDRINAEAVGEAERELARLVSDHHGNPYLWEMTQKLVAKYRAALAASAGTAPTCKPELQVEPQTANIPNFQYRVNDWMLKCFGREITDDATERNHRFLEESLELVQACGITRDEAIQLVDYVFSRPIGEKNQEVGGVAVTLASLCNAQGISMNDAAETELQRAWGKIDQIREKQAAKPKHSPLPAAPQPAPEPVKDDADEVAAAFVQPYHEGISLGARGETGWCVFDPLRIPVGNIISDFLVPAISVLLRSERAKAESKVWQRAEEFASAELRLSRNQGERNSIGEVLIRIRNARKDQPK